MKIILRALAREPSQRFASAREMSKALEPLLPRFSAMNLRSPLVMEDRTEPIASSAVRTERTGPLRTWRTRKAAAHLPGRRPSPAPFP